jgi:putative transposase
MGATADGKKELIPSTTANWRASGQGRICFPTWMPVAWRSSPPGRSRRGRRGRGTRCVRCGSRPRNPVAWVHKTTNVLDKLPEGSQLKARGMLYDHRPARGPREGRGGVRPVREDLRCEAPRDAGCLANDRDLLLTFYDLPTKHWPHIRTANPIESVFSPVRLRQDEGEPKPCGVPDDGL